MTLQQIAEIVEAASAMAATDSLKEGEFDSMIAVAVRYMEEGGFTWQQVGMVISGGEQAWA